MVRILKDRPWTKHETRTEAHLSRIHEIVEVGPCCCSPESASLSVEVVTCPQKIRSALVQSIQRFYAKLLGGLT